MSLESYLQKHPELTEKEYDDEPESTPIEPTKDSSAPTQNKTKRGPWGWIVFLLILILFGVTCPSESDHREAVTAAVRERLYSQDNNNDAISFLLKMATGGIANSFISSELRVHKYLVFSVGKITTSDGEEKTLSVGVLNHVFTFINKESDLE